MIKINKDKFHNNCGMKKKKKKKKKKKSKNLFIIKYNKIISLIIIFLNYAIEKF